MTYVIFSGGELDFVPSLPEEKFVICCDGGIRHADTLGIIPDLLIGDFDSASAQILEKYKDVRTITFPVEKDFTDTESALEFCLKEKASEILIFAATGNRFDHTFCNAVLLAKAEFAGVPAFLINAYNCVTAVSGRREFHKKENYFLSVIPLQESVIVSTTGLYYNLNREKLNMLSSRGISNVFIANTASVTVFGGIALVFLSKD